MEGPKIVKRGGYYYLTVAEGGTAGPATSHMIISARSKSPLGPWENSPYNPVERTRSSSERWWSKGHGTLFEDAKGNWWMLFHAYENGYYNMGRQTLLEPVEWTADGWFRIKSGVKTDSVISYPFTAAASASVTLDDSFTGKQLNPLWKFYGGADTSRWKLTGNGLAVEAKGNSVGESFPLAIVPSAHSYTAEVEMTIEGNATGGLVLFYSNSYHSGILADSTSILADLRAWQFTTVKNVIKRHVFLRLKNSNHTVDMFYSTDGNKWTKIENSAEVSGLHHNVLGGFSGLRIALVAQGSGTVIFKNFRYKATGI